MCKPSMSPTAKLTEEYPADNEHRNDSSTTAEVESGACSKSRNEWCSNHPTNSQVRGFIQWHKVSQQNRPENGTRTANQ